MRKNIVKIQSIALLTFLAFGAHAQAATQTLTFDTNTACGNNPCTDGQTISQSYGDIPGQVNVSYFDVNNSNAQLNWWNTQYNDLQGVVWAGGGDSNSHARIEIKSLLGETVTLNSFDLGAWPNTTRDTHLRITTIGGGTTLFSYDGSIGFGSTQHNTFAPNVTAQGGLWIDWYDSAYNVGIDNISYTTAVPEPESYAMLLLGLGVLAATARQRKASSAQ
jgi:PEP-CTERM motif